MYDKKSVGVKVVVGLILLVIILFMMFFLVKDKILPGRDRINRIGDEVTSDIYEYDNNANSNYKRNFIFKIFKTITYLNT